MSPAFTGSIYFTDNSQHLDQLTPNTKVKLNNSNTPPIPNQKKFCSSDKGRECDRRVVFDLGNGKLRAPTDEPTPINKAIAPSPALSFTLPDFLLNTQQSPLLKFTLPDFSKPSPGLSPQVPKFKLPDSLENTPNQNGGLSPVQEDNNNGDITPLELC